MIRAIIEHGHLTGVRALHDERGIVGCPAESGSVSYEEFALGNKGVEFS